MASPADAPASSPLFSRGWQTKGTLQSGISSTGAQEAVRFIWTLARTKRVPCSSAPPPPLFSTALAA